MKTKFKPKIYKDMQKKLVVFHGLCKGCGLCIEKCPVKAVTFSQSDLGYLSTPCIEININKCISCRICEVICPDCAINIV